MKYQDIWVNGGVIGVGRRDCSSRYEVIRKFCESIDKPFTVLDIGSNMCYFPLRLIEDFGCTAIAFEFHQFAERLKYVQLNKTNNLMFVNHKVTLTDLKTMSSFCYFDVILALSVLHHVNEPINLWLDALKKLGKNIIIEFATTDSKRASSRENYSIPDNHVILGCGKSHLDKNIDRPIILIKGNDEETFSN